jgi:TOMM system kinase/cyclase fusion protein
MDFYDVLERVLELLQRHKRVTYRALQRQFDLDAAYLEDLKAEIIEARQLAVDEEGKVLVWTGPTDAPAVSALPLPQAVPQPAAPQASPPHDVAPLAQCGASEAQRRQLTVLFCDLVDSTPLARQLDPEDYCEVIRAYQTACADVIQRFDGYIAQYLGDGLLVYFGYPQAHEDDAQRAGRAGLEILDAIAPLKARLAADKGLQLAVRLGIHTGLVVVGAMGTRGRQESLAVGDTPNIAARLQGLAAPDTVVISDATWRLVQGYFACNDLGSQPLKGVETPVQAYRILGTSEAQSRLDVVSPRGLTPLVGRETEVTLLRERWAQARDGLGQVVLLSGEAGIGKSRLVMALKEYVAGEPHTRWECRCSPYFQDSALYPLIDRSQRALQFGQDESPETKLQKLEVALQRHGLARPETVALWAALLSIPLAAPYPPLNLTPQRQKQQTLEAIVALLLALAAEQPVLFIVEDAHWIDPSTLEFLNLLIDQGPTARLLTLLTCRPEFHASWGFRAHLTPLTLSRLPRPQVAQMSVRVAGGKALPPEVVEQIVAKTDGVPLFVEELTKTVLESGLLREGEDCYELAGPLPPLAIPATLHDSLMARLDRLATVKDVVQLGATIGRTFSYELLQMVSPLDDAMLQHSLRQLVEAELVYQRGVPPQATYTFKHALIQDAAYQSLLRSTRQQYHQRIAQVLAERFPETIETQPELLAHHYTEAGLSTQAVVYWQRAGKRASERSAYVEAVNHLRKGLAVLQMLPDTPARLQHELALQTTLGPALIATRGFGASEVAQAYTRARELCRQMGETPDVFPVLRGLWVFHEARAELRVARELAEQLLVLAQRLQDPMHLIEAYRALGNTLFWLGEFAPARVYLEQAIALYDVQQHRSLAFLYGTDPAVVCLSYAARALWLLGYPDQARRRSAEALTLAQELSHSPSLAVSLPWAAYLHQSCREVLMVQERAEALMGLAAEQGFQWWLAMGTFFRDWALVQQGRQSAEEMARLRQGLAAYWTTGVELERTYWLALLAEAYGTVGQAEEGLCLLREALVVVENSDEQLWEAELYRLQGDLLLHQTVPDAQHAEACFCQALATARRQQAKALELRAAMSLARLWQRQGKHAEARQTLAEVYAWFTEGFDTADLREARALLDTLA